MSPFTQKGEPRNFKNVHEDQNAHPLNKDIALCSYRPVNLVNLSLFWVYMISKIIHIVVRCFKTCPVFSTGIDLKYCNVMRQKNFFMENQSGTQCTILNVFMYWKILIEKNIDKNKELFSGTAFWVIKPFLFCMFHMIYENNTQGNLKIIFQLSVALAQRSFKIWYLLIFAKYRANHL